jgi:hypothetical protein
MNSLLMQLYYIDGKNATGMTYPRENCIVFLLHVHVMCMCMHMLHVHVHVHVTPANYMRKISQLGKKSLR